MDNLLPLYYMFVLLWFFVDGLWSNLRGGRTSGCSFCRTPSTSPGLTGSSLDALEYSVYFVPGFLVLTSLDLRGWRWSEKPSTGCRSLVSTTRANEDLLCSCERNVGSPCHAIHMLVGMEWRNERSSRTDQLLIVVKERKGRLFWVKQWDASRRWNKWSPCVNYWLLILAVKLKGDVGHRWFV